MSSTTIPATNTPSATTCYPKIQKVVKPLKIVFFEAIATIRYVVPSLFCFITRVYLLKTIKSEKVSKTADKVTKVATLYIHGKTNKEKESILFCHGDFSHPFSLLPLIDIAKKTDKNVFSLYIPSCQNNKQFDLHIQLVEETISKIKTISSSALTGVGHSKGAILLAHTHFVEKNNNLDKVVTLAGRIRAPKPEDCKEKALMDIVDKISEGITNCPNRPLYQIVPKDDWNASQESMIARQESAFVVPGMHLSGIYTKEAKEVLSKILT